MKHIKLVISNIGIRGEGSHDKAFVVHKDLGMGLLVICDRATEKIRALSPRCIELYPDGDGVEDEYRIMTDVVVGQILGTFKSIAVGLKPDNPSTSGTISRVVQGVKIYPL